MAKIIITPDMFETKDGRLVAALTEKYGDDFRRLRKDKRNELIRDIGKIFSAFGGVDVPMENKGYGAERAYALEQEGRDQDLERLKILSAHKKQLLALQSQEVRTSGEDKRVFASLVRSLTNLGVQQLSTAGSLKAKEIEARMAVVDARMKRDERQREEIGKLHESGAKKADKEVSKLYGTLGSGDAVTTASFIAMDEALIGFGNDAAARAAYINQLKEDGIDVISLLQGPGQSVLKESNEKAKATAKKGEKPEELSIAVTPEQITKYENEARAEAEELAALDDADAANLKLYEKIGAYAGIDPEILATVNSAISDYRMVGDPSGRASGIRDYDSVDRIQELYDKYEKEQDEAEAKRSITEWAQLDQMMATNEAFQRHKKEYAPGATDREYFRELEIANLERKDREQEVIDEERGVSDTMDRAEKIASGEALNASGLERLVAKTRLGARRLGRGIVDLFDGDDDEPEGLTPEQLELDALPEAGAHLDNDTDLLNEDKDERASLDNPSAKGTSGANADAESPQAPGGESQEDKDAKKKQAKKVTREKSVTGFGSDDAPKLSDYYGG